MAESFALKAPFRISRGVKHGIEVISVALADGAYIGRGEGVPYPRYGETVAGSLDAVEGCRAFIERGGGRVDLLRHLPPGAARNALDCALWDLEAQASGQTVFELAGIERPRQVRTALTVALDSPAAMAAAAAALPPGALIKVKVDALYPQEQLRAVRGAAPLATLIVDPNESWDERLVRELQPLLVELGVALLEQPVPAEEDGWLAGFEPRVPICADEAVHTAADLRHVRGRYQFVNIKLDKAGGLTAALELARAARVQGLGLMSGCMVCSSLSIAPALALASLSEFVDLDGPLWLRQDRPGGITERKGFLLGPAPGFWGDAAPPSSARKAADA